MKITTEMTVEDKRRWKVVRLDDYKDIPGEIIAADDEAGTCIMSVTSQGETNTVSWSLGPGALKIVGRRH